VVLLGGSSVLSDSLGSDSGRGSVNDGEWVTCDCAVINGEMAGSPTSDDVPAVSTVRVGSLGCLLVRSLASSCSVS